MGRLEQRPGGDRLRGTIGAHANSGVGPSDGVTRYLARRVGLSALVVAGVVLLTFVIARVVPGDPASTWAGPHASAAQIEQARHELGLDRPLLLQIGSYKSEAEASESWRAFKARHAVVAGYQSDVNEAHLGPKGVWYRLRVGPFADRQSAVGVCEKLRAEGANCLVTR